MLALADAQHKIDLKQKRLWNSVLDEMEKYHRYKEKWGWGFIELQLYKNCTSDYCRIMRGNNQLHHHVRMYGKYRVKLKVDPWDEFNYYLGITDQPPDTSQELTASLALLEQSHSTITRSIQHAKRVISNHHEVIV